MYYPLSQIKTNLYTNDGEYTILSSREEYTGYYWKTSDGKFFTGRTPQDTPTNELVKILEYNSLPNTLIQQTTLNSINQEDVRNTLYLDVKNVNIEQVILIPTYAPTYPTAQDYQVGEFRRFFCKKSNEIQYIEIDPKQYSLLTSKDPQILWQLYTPFNIPWVISGTAQNIFQTNKNMVELTMKQLKLPRFNEYLKNDYIKYSV
jgi:hypothetical protein